MTRTPARPLPPFLYVACAFGFAGAAMLLLTPFLPLARIELLGETIEAGMSGEWGVAVCGLVGAAFPAAAIARRSPVWATGLILPAIVAIGWSGWFALSHVPEMARLADRAELGSGGMLFVFSGPLLMIGGLAALIAAYGRIRDEADAASP